MNQHFQTAEKRQREQRNIKRNVDWKNISQSVDDQGPMKDNFIWDEIDKKVKSLIYLSLGTEGTNIFHQCNPHTELGKCITDAIVIELIQAYLIKPIGAIFVGVEIAKLDLTKPIGWWYLCFVS